MDEKKPRYRHELKYGITYGEYMTIRQRLKAVMETDSHVEADGKYLIRSVYFDNYSDKALREKVNGNRYREKFRIRYYNDDLSFITLEKKIKHDDLCMKIDAPVNEAECRKILDGDTDFMRACPSELVRELYTKMKSEQLRPRVLVSYTREPFIYPAGNVRVTFDYNVRSTLYHRSFFEETVRDIEVSDGGVVMEVKFDDFLPEIISYMIQSDGVRQTSFSKYAACRRYG